MNRLSIILTGVMVLTLSVAWAEKPTTVPIQLTDGPGNDTEAAWSPDGNHVAFQSDRDGGMKLYILNLSDRSIHHLDTGPGFSCFPAWSPVFLA